MAPGSDAPSSAPPPTWSRRDLAALGAIAAVVLFLFREVASGQRVIFERDVHVVWLAQMDALVRALGSGAWPLWDPLLSFGQPLLGNPNNQVLYPFSLLHLLLWPGPFYALYVCVHLVLAGAGAYGLLRSWEATRGAALTGGLAFVLSGPLLSVVSVWHHLGTACWLPWVVWAADRALRLGGARNVALWGLAVAAQVLAGSPDFLASSALVQLALAAALAERPWAAWLKRTVPRALGAALLALALSAGQWLPTLQLVRGSERAALPDDQRLAWSLPPVALPALVLPAIPSSLPLDPRNAALAELRVPFLRSVYLGLPGLLLVGAALARGGRTGRFLAAVLAGAVLLGLGRHLPFLELATLLVPPLRSLRYPEKFLLSAGFAWALLCGRGFDAWREGAGAPRLRPWSAAALSLGWTPGLALVVGALARPDLFAPSFALPPGQTAVDALWPLVRRVGLSLGLALAAWLATRLAAAPAAPALAIAAATVLDLALVHRPLNPTAPPEVLAFRPPTVDALRRDGAGRVLVWDYAALAHPRVPDRSGAFGSLPMLPGVIGVQAYLRPPLPERWGLGGSYDPDLLGLYPPFLTRLVSELPRAVGTPVLPRLLQRAGVDHVVALHEETLSALPLLEAVPGFASVPIQLRRVPEPLPRVLVVPEALAVDDEAALARLRDAAFDPRRTVLLAAGGRGQASRPLPAAGGSGSARIAAERADHLEVEADLAAPGYLLLLDTFEEGWRTAVDGSASPLLRANVAFRAVFLPAGRHRVTMTYRPPAVLAGLALSGAAVLVLLGLLVRGGQAVSSEAPAGTP